MGIEDQIQQQTFKSELEKAVVNIAFTEKYFQAKISNVLKPYGLSIPQFNVLRIVKGQHPEAVSINDIGSRMIDKMSNASRLVDKLCSKELLERQTCSYDKRQVDVLISKKGIDLLPEINSLVSNIIAEHGGLSESELTQLNLFLDKLRKE